MLNGVELIQPFLRCGHNEEKILIPNPDGVGIIDKGLLISLKTEQQSIYALVLKKENLQFWTKEEDKLIFPNYHSYFY